MSEPYTIEQHQHRFAAWAASRAASTSSLCRFPVEEGFRILKAAGLDAHLSSPDQLPAPTALDNHHRDWRSLMMDASGRPENEFSHGVAAKLINIYLKARFVCGGFSDHENVKCLHPPIDRTLLRQLKEDDFGGCKKQWGQFERKGWSTFDSDYYEKVVNLIRECQRNEALWMIEKHWKGFQ